jgi:hypothetical protein
MRVRRLYYHYGYFTDSVKPSSPAAGLQKREEGSSALSAKRTRDVTCSGWPSARPASGQDC